MSEETRADAVLTFINRYLDDVSTGGAHGVDHYQAAYPGHETAIAAEYERLASIAAAGQEAPMRGRRVGGYELIEEIGRGAQATVYLAQDTRLPRKVALKIVRDSGLGGSEQALARFRREAALVSRLDHPGLCTVYESGLSKVGPFIAMRYVEGGSLADAIVLGAAGRDGPGMVPLPPEPEQASPRVALARVLTMLEQAARALDVAHRAGVVHRDVKPSNVLLAADGAPVIVDFGLAHDSDADAGLTLSGTQCGTPAYMAPEQIRAEGQPDARVDVYALGVTAFEALTGARPFVAASREGLYRRILAGGPPDPCRLVKALPREVRVVLQTAMEIDPHRRYGSAAEFADDLRRVRAREPILAEPPGPVLRTWRWVQRNPLAAALIAALVAGLVVASWSVVGMLTARARADDTARQLDSATLDGLTRDVAENLWPERPRERARLRKWLETAAVFVVDCRARHAGPDGGDTQAALARFVAEPDGAVAQVRARLAHIEAIEALSVRDAAAAWAEVGADLRADSRFGSAAPQTAVFGLVPLGADPASGLHEFWFVRSGERPERDASGRWCILEHTGAVFVLVPGGQAVLGAQARDPHAPHYCALAQDDEQPVYEVELAPFFCSKFELTQGQWLRLVGDNPSRFVPGGSEWSAAPSPHPLAHPVEQVSFEEAALWLPRYGMQLPSEAQWEYACAAGCETPWWPGAAEGDLVGAANLADEALHRQYSTFACAWPFDDGYALHAPVDAFTANPFGLVGCIGNVGEWCADMFARYDVPARRGDGFRAGADSGKRVVRGGNFEWGAALARTTYRAFEPIGNRTYQVGIRPVIALP